jgi:hypothetical protein
MARSLTLRELDPVFVEVAKAVFGDDADPRELWQAVHKMGPDGSELHIDSTLTPAQQRKKERKLATGALAGTGVAAVGGLHAIKATGDEHQARVARLTGQPVPTKELSRVGRAVDDGMKRLPFSGKTIATVGTAGWLGLHGVELGADALNARAQVKALQGTKKPLSKALRLKPLNPQVVRRTPSLRAQRPKLLPMAKSAEGPVNLLWRGEISKVDTARRQVFGWLSVAEIDGQTVTDLQEDRVKIDEVEKAAYTYVTESRVGGDMHERVAKYADAPRHTMDLIESFVVTPEKLEAMGLPPDALPLGWWGGFQVNDEQQWQDFKSGRRTGFSVHGTGRRVPVTKSETERPTLRQRTRAAVHPPAVRTHAVDSSAIARMGYQRPTRRLAVAMRSRPDEPYEYRLSPAEAKAAMDAPSKGSHYAKEIRGKAQRAQGYTAGDRVRLFFEPPVSKAVAQQVVDVAGATGAAAAKMRTLPLPDRKASQAAPATARTLRPAALTTAVPQQSTGPPIPVLAMKKPA